jgi:hypothetical protein
LACASSKKASFHCSARDAPAYQLDVPLESNVALLCSGMAAGINALRYYLGSASRVCQKVHLHESRIYNRAGGEHYGG